MAQVVENRPLISVITVCKNAERTIERAFYSLQRQTDDGTDSGLLFADFEHIIVDGASTDSTKRLIEQYSETAQFPVTIISEPDQGIYDAMNKGLACAKGLYTVFLNADDVFTQNAFVTVADYAKELPDCIGGDCDIVDRNGNAYLRKCLPSMISERYPQIMPAQHQAWYVKTDTLQMAGGFDQTFPIAADYELALRLIEDKVSWMFVPHTVARFYLGGVSFQLARTAWDCFRVRRARRWPIVFASRLLICNIVASYVSRVCGYFGWAR
ncbi:MAG: glycosyltransferase [Coriobacteriia bacterium]|nr:glycosyltransferase [Coriobacteriia bacterium]